MINTKELAGAYMTSARTIFLDDGTVDPVVAFHGGPTSLLVELRPHPEFHPSDQAVSITYAFSIVLEATHVVAVNETWMRKFGLHEASPRSLERGQLQRMHQDGDTNVHTAILVIAADLAHHENSYVLTRDVDQDGLEEDSEGWNERDLNLGSGSYLDRLLDAWAQGKEAAKGAPPGGGWEIVAGILAMKGMISSVVRFGPREEVDEVMRRVKAGQN